MTFKKLILGTYYLQALNEFYSSILELPALIVKERKLIVKVGSSDLVFVETKGSEPFYHFAINIPSNKIDDAKTWLIGKVKLLWMEEYKNDIAEFVNWRARSIYFFDPAGNILELIARFDLKNEAEGPFSPTQLLSINEVGLVFDAGEFEQKIAALLNDYNLSYFAKQPPLPHFRAIGDDEALFVIVPTGRNWFPTNKPSTFFPMTIEFMDRKNNHWLTLSE